MNAKIKTLFGIVLFVVLMGGAYLAYNNLGAKNRPDLSAPVQKENNPPPQAAIPDESSEPAITENPDKPAHVTPTESAIPDEETAKEDDSQTEAVEKLAALDFSVYDAQGNEVKLSDFFGKPIVINFWATWCPYCVEEMPVFEQAFQKYGNEIQFLMIDSVDGQRETQAKGERFIQEEGFTFPVFFDTDGSASFAYEVYSLPTSVFIDPDGYVIVYHPGGLTADMLQQGIGYIYSGE
ncbi:MAG: redoxin domain-containing protein [Thermoclostridium sp.]|nr:redoxin domain-containing protein [Thermoclostridium sp.]